jgi:hypothetical protein
MAAAKGPIALDTEFKSNGKTSNGNFKVVIVGGSVSGLGLANVCERLGGCFQSLVDLIEYHFQNVTLR